jgi:hypothetical protein
MVLIPEMFCFHKNFVLESETHLNGVNISIKRCRSCGMSRVDSTMDYDGREKTEDSEHTEPIHQGNAA